MVPLTVTRRSILRQLAYKSSWLFFLIVVTRNPSIDNILRVPRSITWPPTAAPNSQPYRKFERKPSGPSNYLITEPIKKSWSFVRPLADVAVSKPRDQNHVNNKTKLARSPALNTNSKATKWVSSRSPSSSSFYLVRFRSLCVVYVRILCLHVDKVWSFSEVDRIFFWQEETRGTMAKNKMHT
jgi:hypothetical protein